MWNVDIPYFVEYVDQAIGSIMTGQCLAIYGFTYYTKDTPAMLGWFLADV